MFHDSRNLGIGIDGFSLIARAVCHSLPHSCRGLLMQKHRRCFVLPQLCHAHILHLKVFVRNKYSIVDSI